MEKIAGTPGSGYRGDLKGAYQEWHEGGRPEDPTDPLMKKLLDEANLFVGRITSLKYRCLVLDGNLAVMADLFNLARVEQANEKSIQSALTQYDPNDGRNASFTTYLKKAVLNNFQDELRRTKRPPHQKEFLRAHNGDKFYAHLWIDEELPRHIAPKDRPLAHWFIDQDPDMTITWWHVLAAFPNYRTESRAGRALRRVKKAIEKAGFYRFR